jgi:hypothetical protein
VTARGAAALAFAIALAAAVWLPGAAAAQPARMVKVVIEMAQDAVASQQGVQGGGGAIVRQEGGNTRARARGGVAVEDTTTKTRRTVGVFVVVEDGGAATLMVAQDVPFPQIGWFHDHATGRGHAIRDVAWQRLGTGLAVRPAILPERRIRVRVAPWLSYEAAGGGGAVEMVEAATEVVVPAGQRVALGGATTELHAVTRRILGVREERSGSQTGIAIIATIQ